MKFIKLRDNSKLYNKLLMASRHSKKTLKQWMKEDLDCKFIDHSNFVMDDTIVFDSEEDYFLFLLKL